MACALLDCCAKNCGYPFQIIISTKEFLNDLVKRFPDRPINVGPVQYHVLDLIGTWNNTLWYARFMLDFHILKFGVETQA